MSWPPTSDADAQSNVSVTFARPTLSDAPDKLGSVTFSPTHLANFLACRHTLTLELEARAGLRERPTYSDPLADQLRKRGEDHEQQ